MLAVALALLLGQSPQSPRGPVVSGANLRPTSGPVLDFGLLSATPWQELCPSATDAGVLSGAWYCFQNDGGTDPAGRGLTLGSSSQVLSRARCPSGTNCAPYTFNRPSNGYWQTDVGTDFTGDFSFCWWGRIYQGNGVAEIINKWNNGGGATLTYALEKNSTGDTLTYYVGKTPGTLTSISTSNFSPRTWSLICGTYDYVTDGTSVMRLYVNGVQQAVSTTAVGPPISQNTKHSLGTFGIPGTGISNDIGGAFATETLMTAPQVLRLYQDVQGGVLSQGTFARTGTQSCETVDGGVLLLPDGVPCVSRNGRILNEPAATNLIQHGTNMANGAWTLTNATRTGGGESPDTTGDTNSSLWESVTSTVAGGYIESPSFVISATSGNAGAYVSVTAGTQAVAMALRDTTAGVDRCTATLTATTTTQPLYCGNEALTSGNTHVLRLYPGGTGATGTALFWGAQATTTAQRTSLIQTPIGATAARTATTLVTTRPSSLLTTLGCATACIEPMFTAISPTTIDFIRLGATAQPLYNNAGGGAIFVSDGTVSTNLGGSINFNRAYSPRCFRSSWNVAANQLKVKVLGWGEGAPAEATTTTSGMSTFAANVGLGNDTTPTAGQARGYIYGLRVGATTTACQSGGVKMALLGDSNTCCPAGTSSGWGVALQGMSGITSSSLRIDNFAAPGGGTVAVAQTSFNSSVSGQGYSRLGLLVGYHDINASSSAATIYTAWSALADQAEAAGIRVTPIKLLCFGAAGTWTAPKEAERVALNALIQGWCDSKGRTCVSPETALCTGTSITAAYDSGDGLHLNQAGSDILAGLVKAVVEP